MSDFNEYYKRAWELNLIDRNKAIEEATLKGYNMAIDALNTMEADGLHEMYACGFAEWLDKKRWEILKGNNK